MKTILFAAAVLLAGMRALPEQQIPAEPQYPDVFMRLDAGNLVPLERQTAVMKSKSAGFIVMSMKRVADLSGAKSDVRFHSAPAMEFVVRTAAPTAIDPGSVYLLRKLTVKKDSRELKFMSGHVTPFGSSLTRHPLGQDVLPVSFSKYGESSLKLTAHDLPPGEYALSRAYGTALFCFGVD
jgi:hypothetical protein